MEQKVVRTQLGVGDAIWYRLYNTPEGKFYGEICDGVVIAIHNGEKPIEVRTSTGTIRLHRKEVKGRKAK